jgi:hypothetical protein
MLLQLRRYLTRHEYLLKLPWLFILDAIGLALSLFLVFLQIESKVQERDGRVFI